MTKDEVIDQIFVLFAEKGDNAYFGEAISELEHALQAAHLATSSGANNDQIVAALLHDIGHLLHGKSEDIASVGVDARHEEEGAAWLARYFPASVVDPIRMHVAAKRFLCAIEPAYLEALSPASLQSLKLQGGTMSDEEVSRFRQHSLCEAIVAVRRWDDHAKVVGLEVPDLEHYRGHLKQALVELP